MDLIRRKLANSRGDVPLLTAGSLTTLLPLLQPGPRNDAFFRVRHNLPLLQSQKRLYRRPLRYGRLHAPYEGGIHEYVERIVPYEALSDTFNDMIVPRDF